MYKYVIYNYILCSNYSCDYLTTVDVLHQYENKMIQVKIILSDSIGKKKNFTYKCSDSMFVGDWNGVAFSVDFEKFAITITAPSVETAYLVLLNVPLSLLLLSESKIILHCSCVIDNNGLYAFLGNKGSGKSTICSIFAANNRSVFSDDTICIDVINKRLYSNNAVEKYSYNTLSFLEEITTITNLKKNNYNNKFIKKLDTYNEPQNLKKLNFVFLFKATQFYSKKVFESSVKKFLLLNNVVGYKYANPNIKSTIVKSIDQILAEFDLNAQILFVPHIESNCVYNFQQNLENILVEK